MWRHIDLGIRWIQKQLLSKSSSVAPFQPSGESKGGVKAETAGQLSNEVSTDVIESLQNAGIALVDDQSFSKASRDHIGLVVAA